MDNQYKDGDSDSRESYGFKISDLLKALAELKSPPTDISATLSTLKNTGTDTSNTRGTFRSRAVLPENISQLSESKFKRRDHLKESLRSSAPVPAPGITAVASSQEGQLQPGLPSDPLILALLVEKSKLLPSESVCSIGERLKDHELYPHILGVHAWSKQQFCEPWRTLPGQFPQKGPTTEWFFEDLTDLQRKRFLRASKKSGVQRSSQTAGKTTRLG